MKLLLIDQGDAGDWLADHLGGLGFIPERAGSVDGAIRDGMANNVMAVIADTGFGGHCAESIVRPLRMSGVDQPLMILAPLQDWREMIDCLDAGADDHVVKPRAPM